MTQDDARNLRSGQPIVNRSDDIRAIIIDKTVYPDGRTTYGILIGNSQPSVVTLEELVAKYELDYSRD